ALVLAARARGVAPRRTADGAIALGDDPIPGSRNNRIAINFDGGAGAIPTYSLADLRACAEKGDAAYFRRHFAGKVVFIGAVLDVEVDPRNVCTIYALKPGRLLKSTDCNRTFTSVYVETRGDEQLTAFVLDWFNPDIIWIATTAGDINRSSDGGQTWSSVHRVKDEVVSIILSHSDSRIVLVGTEDKGLFRSEDAGGTWAEFESELKKEFKNSDIFYGFAQTRDGSTLIMNTKYGLLRSRDHGSNWEAIPLTTAPGDVRIWDVAIHPENGETLYYGTTNILYQSTNSGDAWGTEELPSTRAPKAMLVHPSTTGRLLVGFAASEQ
ncbi:hypothetical protein IH979_01730, partial [Patescibacteria group bacterium]|nr:hypothetical protein [Patescibacteria group bacterium]